MNEKEYFIDDRVIIPDNIMKMSREELDAQIKRLEAEAAAEKQRILAASAHKAAAPNKKAEKRSV